MYWRLLFLEANELRALGWLLEDIGFILGLWLIIVDPLQLF